MGILSNVIIIVALFSGSCRAINIQTPNDPHTSPSQSETQTTFPKVLVSFDVNGIGGATVTWAITDTTSCPAALFEIVSTDNDEADLRLKAAPDYETATTHNCPVQATNPNDGTSVTWATVTIPITDENDETPTLANTPYACTIEEESSVGTLVTGCNVVFDDKDANDKPYCSLSGANADLFSVTTDLTNKKCIISVTGKYDRDKIPKSIPSATLNLNIHVTDKAGNTVFQPATVTVTDINDNAPFCDPKIKYFYVNEDSNVDFDVISCTDSDDGNNKVIKYSIISGNTGTIFTLGADDGVLTAPTLDYDVVNPNYQLVIHAIDQHATAALRKTTTVTANIIVKPINEHAPVWVAWVPPVPATATDPISTISEHATPGTQVFQAKATDKDFGVDGIITYKLTSVTGNDGSDLSALFSIDSLGNVRKQGSTLLDMETFQTITFNVRAEDKDAATNFVTQTVKVSVVDVNEFPPKFQNLLTTVTIPERETAGTEIHNFVLTDADTETALVPKCEIVSGDVPTKFKIDDTIKTKVVIDTGGGPDPDSPNLDPRRYELAIECRDLNGGVGSLPSRATLQIDVVPSNDHDPLVTAMSTSLTFPEDNPTGKILDLSPSDKDRGLGGSLSCTIDPASGPFRVSSDCSSLLQVSSFDFETTTSYSINLKITDDGGRSFSIPTPISVTITNVNDNYPVCSPQLTTVSIFENVAANTEIATIVCDDKDETASPKANLVLINEGSLPFKFDANSGKVTVETPPDYDAATAVIQYDLTVRATDKQSATMFVDSTIKVLIKPLEDNVPAFASNPTVQFPEDKTPGSFVVSYTATDDDKPPHNIKKYELISVDNGGAGKFILEPTGTVRVAAGASFDYDTMPVANKKYLLLITASDGTNEVTGTVTVEITDVNDNPPILSQTVYTGTIAENAAAGDSTGVTLSATDADESDTAATFSKVAGSGDPNNYFQVDPSSGVISRSSSGTLDYDTEKLVTFKVKATDRTTGLILSTESHVIVNVVDVNQNTPTCTGSPTISKSLPENTALGTVIVDFSTICSDADTTQKLVYSVVTASDYFDLNTVNGKLVLTKAMDVEDSVTKPYSATIKVSDNHGTPKSIDMKVDVTPTNIDEEAPSCTTVPSSVEVKEDAATGATVFSLLGCKDIDSPTLGYEIITVDTNPGSGPFTIDASGVGKMGSLSLDYETKTSYALVVKVTDKTSSPALYDAQYNILVKILPVNEHDPVNTITSATATIREDLAVGSTVVIAPALAATDADKGEDHGTIYWEIVGGNDERYFTMTRDGTIRVAKPLDYEAIQNIVLKVQALDGPGKRSTVIEDVSITITDINDNSPKFSAVHSTVNIQAGTTAPSNLLDFVPLVSDADSGVNADYTLSFDASYPEFQFDTATGKILQTKNPLPISRTQYVLVVKAIDKGTIPGPKTGTATVTVNVLENNANPPVFTTGTTYTISESFPIGGLVLDADATDADPGTNGKLTYSITADNSGGKFTINADTGQVYLKSFLDKETSPGPYTLTITGTDGGGKTSSVTYTIVIQDENDNDPQFQAAPANSFAITITENYNLSAGNFYTVATSDKDAGGTQAVKCYIKSQSGSGDRFIIDPNTCIMSVNNPIDRETVPIYNILVELRDSGMTPVRSSEAMFKITLSDQNDNSPDFGSQANGINATIIENTAAGTTIATVQATDRDAGDNAVIDYSLSGPLAGYFTIDAAGVIKTSSVKIDAETYQMMTFDVVATDRGTSPQSTTMKVILEVLDEDEFQPDITGSPYKVNLPENANNWTLLTTIQAKDDDITYNVLSYSLISGDTYGYFTVNKEGKVYFVTGELDRESVPSFTLTIAVSDNAPTPNVVNAIVQVTITDINDNPPKINPQLDVHQSISENSPVDSPVPGGANITDADDGPDNNRLTYTLDAVISGPDYFKISATTGVISVKTAALDREAKDEYILRIKVRDNGTPSLSISYTVTITLLDENDNTPIFNKNPYTTTVPENIAVGTDILTVEATDADINQNADISYFLKSGFPVANSLFSVNSNTGVISIKGSLDYETVKVHVFQVTAVDDGSPKRTGSTTITVTVTDVNDVSPTVSPAFISTEVPLADNGQMLIATVSHTDPDTGVGGEATYGWNSATIHFTIDSNTGIIRRNTAHQLIVDSTYVEYVEAKDKGSPSLTSTSSGTVRIDTFALEEYTVVIYFAASLNKFNDNLDAIKTGLSEVLKNKYPDNRVGLWTAVQQGSETKAFFYGVQNRDTDKIENINQEKKFIPKSDLLAYWRADNTGQPTVALQTFRFVNSTVTLVEPYPQGSTIAWFQTPAAIAGLTVGAVALAALLAGLIALLVLKCGGCPPCPQCPPCPPGNAASSYAPQVSPSQPASQPPPPKPTRELLQLNKDKHPKKVENITGEDKQDPRPRSSNKTKIVDQDISDEIFNPDQGELRQYEAPIF